MTTEVLRNMIYGRSSSARRPRSRRARRGALPTGRVPRTGLGGGDHPPSAITCSSCACRQRSATSTSSPTWITTVRGPTVAIVERSVPCELVNLYLAKDRERRIDCTSCRCSSTVPSTVMRSNSTSRRSVGGATGAATSSRSPRGAVRRRLVPPGRVETVELLDHDDMLPAIFFIFSRNQCDEAASPASMPG